MTPTPAHNGPYSELTADAARDLRRPISPDEVRFKVQAVRWTKRDGPDKVATAAQVVAYIDARTVVARLNLLFPGRWHAPTDALPLDMRLTRRGADGTLTPIRVSDQGQVKASLAWYVKAIKRLAPLKPLPNDARVFLRNAFWDEWHEEAEGVAENASAVRRYREARAARDYDTVVLYAGQGTALDRRKHVR